MFLSGSVFVSVRSIHHPLWFNAYRHTKINILPPTSCQTKNTKQKPHVLCLTNSDKHSLTITKKTSNNQNSNNRQSVNQMIESNGSSKHLHGTLPRETTTLPASGNLHHPAGPLGKIAGTILRGSNQLTNLLFSSYSLPYKNRVPPHSTQIDGQSPSHLVPGKLRQLGPDLSQQTSQKDEWFV